MKKYSVTLTEAQREALSQRVVSGRGPARELTRARILLKADSGPTRPRVCLDEAGMLQQLGALPGPDRAR